MVLIPDPEPLPKQEVEVLLLRKAGQLRGVVATRVDDAVHSPLPQQLDEPPQRLLCRSNRQQRTHCQGIEGRALGVGSDDADPTPDPYSNSVIWALGTAEPSGMMCVTTTPRARRLRAISFSR